MNDTQRMCLKFAAAIGTVMLLYCPYEELFRLDMPALPQGFKFIFKLDANQRINSNQLFVQYVALGFITACAVAATGSKKG